MQPSVTGGSLSPDAWLSLRDALRLSEREIQIVQSVFEDRKEECIAARLAISPHTVNTYFRRVYAKLQVSSRPQLIVKVMMEYLAIVSERADVSGVRVTDEHATWR